MTLHQRRHGVVAPTDHGGNRDASAQTGVQHQMITLQKAHVCETKATQSVLLMRVHTGVVEH